MSRFIEGEHCHETTLFPKLPDEYISENNAIRVIEAFVDGLDLFELGFSSAKPKQQEDRLITSPPC